MRGLGEGRGFTYLPHTTDAYIAASGATLEEALEWAGLALFDVMCDVSAISMVTKDILAVEGRDELSLSYNWLEALLLKFELERKAYRKFKIGQIRRVPEGLRLEAEAFGEQYDRSRHGSKVEVKAVTYHRMEILHEGSKVTLKFILDL